MGSYQSKKEACFEMRDICDEIQNELCELNDKIIYNEENAIYSIKDFCQHAKSKKSFLDFLKLTHLFFI